MSIGSSNFITKVFYNLQIHRQLYSFLFFCWNVLVGFLDSQMTKLYSLKRVLIQSKVLSYHWNFDKWLKSKHKIKIYFKDSLRGTEAGINVKLCPLQSGGDICRKSPRHCTAQSPCLSLSLSATELSWGLKLSCSPDVSPKPCIWSTSLPTSCN